MKKRFNLYKMLLVGAGGFIGAVARYGLTGLVYKFSQSAFPYGTLAVNVIGCFFAGLLMFMTEDKMILSSNVRLFLGIGLLGGFTTFSTFGYETIELIKNNQLLSAGVYVLANVVLGLAAVWLVYIVLRNLNS